MLEQNANQEKEIDKPVESKEPQKEEKETQQQDGVKKPFVTDEQLERGLVYILDVLLPRMVKPFN